VTSVRLPSDGGRAKGFGYAEFEDRQSLLDALAFSEAVSLRCRQWREGGWELIAYPKFFAVEKLSENLVQKFSSIYAKFEANNINFVKFRGRIQILSTHNLFVYF